MFVMQDKIITRSQAKQSGEKWYFTGVPCKHGHVTKRQVSNGSCAICSSERTKSWYHAPENIQGNRESAKSRMRERYSDQDVRRSINERRRADRCNPLKGEKIRSAERRRRIDNPEKQIEKQRRQNALRRSSPIGRLAHRASSLIRLTLKNGNWKKPARTEAILGCTMDEFKLMIERQFLPGMSWKNMGQWHLDHIVPISSAKTQSEAEALSRAGNFRPMWGPENLAKSNSVLFLL